MKIILLILFCTVTVFASSPIERVKFSVPPKWALLDKRDSDTLSVRLYFIKADTINRKALYANALFQCYQVPDTVDLRYADDIVAHHTPGGRYILSAIDTPAWKTYLFLANQDSEQYITLYRIGIYQQICFEFMMAFPNKRATQGTDTAMKVLVLNPDHVVDENMSGIYCGFDHVKPFVDEFNSVCTSMEIDNQSSFQANAKLIDPPPDSKIFHDKTLRK